MRFKRHKYTREWNLYRMHWEFKQRSSVISVAKRSKDGAGVKKRIRIICLFRLFNAHFPLPQSLVYVFFQNAKSIRWVHTVWSSWLSGGGAQFYWASKRYKLKIASIFWRCLRQFIVDTVSFQSRFDRMPRPQISVELSVYFDEHLFRIHFSQTLLLLSSPRWLIFPVYLPETCVNFSWWMDTTYNFFL